MEINTEETDNSELEKLYSNENFEKLSNGAKRENQTDEKEYESDDSEVSEPQTLHQNETKIPQKVTCDLNAKNSNGNLQNLRGEKFENSGFIKIIQKRFTQFNGTGEDVHEFFALFDHLSELYEATNLEKSIALQIVLSGTALKVFRSLPKHAQNNYSSIKQKFISIFSPINHPIKLREAYEERKQNSNEKVDTYFVELWTLGKLAWPDWSDEKLQEDMTYRFVRGLNSEIQERIFLLGNPKNLEEAKERASNAEISLTYKKSDESTKIFNLLTDLINSQNSKPTRNNEYPQTFSSDPRNKLENILQRLTEVLEDLKISKSENSRNFEKSSHQKFKPDFSNHDSNRLHNSENWQKKSWENRQFPSQAQFSNVQSLEKHRFYKNQQPENSKNQYPTPERYNVQYNRQFSNRNFDQNSNNYRNLQNRQQMSNNWQQIQPNTDYNHRRSSRYFEKSIRQPNFYPKFQQTSNNDEIVNNTPATSEKQPSQVNFYDQNHHFDDYELQISSTTNFYPNPITQSGNLVIIRNQPETSMPNINCIHLPNRQFYRQKTRYWTNSTYNFKNRQSEKSVQNENLINNCRLGKNLNNFLNHAADYKSENLDKTIYYGSLNPEIFWDSPNLHIY